MEPKPSLFQVASLLPRFGEHMQVSFTLGTAAAIVLVIFVTGFLLGVLGCHWMGRQRSRRKLRLNRSVSRAQD